MRKAIYTLLFLFTISFAFPARAGIQEGVNYLKTQHQDDWVIMALAAVSATDINTASLQSFSGTLATDYAKRILALVAVGQNSSTFTDTDLVAGLLDMASDGQIGDLDLLNDDAWGILALRAVGVPENVSIIADSANFLLNHQQLDGGWGWSANGTSDTNDTAAIVMALLESGYPASGQAITQAVAYLKSAQKPDGGWAYEPIWDSDAASTAWVITALTKLSQNITDWSVGETPVEFLLSLQTEDGSFKWVSSDAVGSASMTAFSVIALANKTFPIKIIHPTSSPTAAAPRLSQVDLVLSLSASKFDGIVGDELVYTVSVLNQGPDPATNIQVNNLTSDFNNADISVDVGSYDLVTHVWYLDSLAVNETKQATIKLILPQPADFNWDIATASTEADVDSSNNKVSAALTVTKPEVMTAEENGQVLGVTTAVCDLPDSPGELDPASIGYPLKPTEGGEVWYYDPISLKRYCLPNAESAYRALEVFGLGITNDDLERIPVAGESTVQTSSVDQGLINRLKGRILLQVESVGEAWYVDPRDGQRHYLPNGQAALNTLTVLAQTAPGREIFPIPVGELIIRH